MSMRGWVVYNGHLEEDRFLDFAYYFHKAANSKGISTDVVKNNDILSFLATDELHILRTTNSSLPDFVIFTDKDVYLARQLELLGVRVFNSADAINISDDKILTYQVLAQSDLPIPKTIIAPKTFFKPKQLDKRYIEQIINTLGFPHVIKEAFGSFGEQVYLVNDLDEMIQKINKLHNKPYVFQEYIQTSYGKDLRLHVVGDEVIASMSRQTENDFRATADGVRLGYHPTDDEIQLAVAATKAIGADFAGVDLLYGPGDSRIICEVNSNAHIGRLHRSSGINVAPAVIDYIIDELQS